MSPLRLSARSKYSAIPTWIDGVRFASKREARRYQQLLLLVKAGEIQNLQLQPAYTVSINGILCCTYKADFRYQTKAGAWVIEDSKGMRTPVYKLKKRLVEAQYGVVIHEV
jgi:hypothetical protein